MAEVPWRSQAPPPAPPGPVGSLPSTRLQTEVTPRGSEPPLVVQNAMMTKDKKPFTYTPGGIDLTEIRSPRMARRLEKNAASEGVQLSPQAMQNQSPGPLPPSALAAMQSAMPIQVFPDGQVPQLGKGGAPPPPPPPSNAVPPPPPPMQSNKQANRKSAVSPIPQNYERPDMTKIIPENPMALLRKSPGPVVKQDPILNRNNYISSGINPLGEAPQPRLSNQQPQSPDIVKPKPQLGTAYVPPSQAENNISTPPGTLKRQPHPFENRVQSPPGQSTPPPFVAQQQQIPSPPVATNKVRSPPPLQRQPQSPESPGSPKVNLNKAPTPWLSQKAQQKDVPPWAIHEQKAESSQNAPEGPLQQPSPQFPGGARIIPVPVAQAEPPSQQRFVSNHNAVPVNRAGVNQPPASPLYNNVVMVNDPPEVYQAPSQGSKVMYLNSQPNVQQPRQPVNQQQQQVRTDPSGARIIPIRVEGASNNVSAQTTRPYVQKISGAPPPIENRPAYNRQQSQSNSFKVLQKITNTDVDVDNEPAVDCAPRSAQQFQQRRVPAEQLRQMKLSEGDQDFVNKFRQGDDQNASLHNEVDPRYRGAAIPSKAFRLLQNMTDGSDDHPMPSTVPYTQPVNRVHQQPQPQPQVRPQQQPQVRERTIPIQIEGDNMPRKYVHPSEQKVPEPKKYTGSAIPSRSFKILQAMTAPENCVDPEQDTENYSIDPSSFEQWGYDPNFPFPPHYPFGPQLRYPRRNCPTPTAENQRKKRIPKCSNRRKSCPYFPPQDNEYASEYESDSNMSTSRNVPLIHKRSSTPMREFDPDFRSHSSLSRGTPVPFWNYYPHPYEYDEEEVEHEAFHYGPPMPPVWDPYSYYAYYYGHYPPPPPRGRPPLYSPYIFYPPHMGENEDMFDYASTDDTANCYPKYASRPPSATNRNENPNVRVSPCRQESFTSSETDTLTQKESYKDVSQAIEDIQHNMEEQPGNSDSKIEVKDSYKEKKEQRLDTSDESDSESISDDEEKNYQINPLVAIPSVADVKVYDVDDQSYVSEDESVHEEIIENASEEADDHSSVYCNDDTTPHLLSTIDELSERTDLTDSKYFKESNVTSDAETTATNSDESDDGEEEGDEDKVRSEALVAVKMPLKMKHTVSDNKHETIVVSVGDKEIKESISASSQHTSEVHTSFTLRSPSRERTPKKGDLSEDGSESSHTSKSSIVSVDRDIVKQTSSVSCESHQSESNASVKVVAVETQTVTEKVTISPSESADINYESRNITANSRNQIEEGVDWWGEISDVTEDSNNNSNENCLDNKKENEELLNQTGEEEIDEDEEVDFWAEIIGSGEEDVTYRRSTSKFNRYNGEISEEKEEAQISKTETDTTLHSANSNISSSSSSDTVGKEAAVMVNSTSSKVETTSQEEIVSQSDATTNLALTYPLEENESSLGGTENTTTENNTVLDNQKEDYVAQQETMYTAVSNVQQTTYHTVEENLQQESDKAIQVSVDASDEDQMQEIPLSVKERIKALENARRGSANQQKQDDQEVKVSVKDRISVFEESNFLLSVENTPSKRSSLSRKSSVRSFEECSEVEDEEVDSGVTSDISKHISEPEADQEFPHLKKMNKYQRASTHSRLFKLLQEECEAEDEAERLAAEAQAAIECPKSNIHVNRDHLELPLKKNAPDLESGVSSGFNSPASPTISEGLVNELVQSLLMKKQAKAFRKMPMEKLQAAAIKILREDVDACQWSPEEFANFFSPTTNFTADSTAIQTPQEFYSSASEYSQYYDSWGETDHSYNLRYDILPSKAFKLIQEHTAMNKTGAITGFVAKCPRVLSAKNVPSEVHKILEDVDSASLSPDPLVCPTQQSEAASAS